MDDLVNDFDYIDPVVVETVTNLPKEVGYWRLHNGFNPVIFPMYRKPRWITRYFMRVIFDITWEDAEYDGD